MRPRKSPWRGIEITARGEKAITTSKGARAIRPVRTLTKSTVVGRGVGAGLVGAMCE